MAEEKIAETVSKEENKEEELHEDVESSIEAAMRARVGYIKEQSNSLTLEGVRRLLEKDLGLEQHALDKHKRFVKQLLADITEDSNDGNDSKNCEDAGEKRNDVETAEKVVAKEEQEQSLEDHQGGKDTNEALSQDASKLDDSPVLGLLKENKAVKSKREKSEEVVEKKAPTNKTIEAAIRKRAKYLKVNSEQLTLAGLRRLLEEDLKLEKHSLDPFKNFIRDQVDEVLLDPKKAARPSPSVKKKVVTKNFKQKVAKKARSEESSDSAESDRDEDEDDVKPKKKNVRKEKASNTPKKRKQPTENKKTSVKKIKATEKSTDNSDEENGNFSEDSHSQSSAEKSTKSRVVSTPAYGKRVENLKSVIKSCGMSVPPALYKKIKQVPENRRETQLIKELQEILSKEGLSSNPSEKEIKEVRKRKERAKELEGIDTSNIVSSTRRRSTTSYAVTAKPKMPVESGSESSEDEEEDEEDDEDDEEEEDDNGNDGSQSEESNVDDEVNSD